MNAKENTIKEVPGNVRTYNLLLCPIASDIFFFDFFVEPKLIVFVLLVIVINRILKKVQLYKKF